MKAIISGFTFIIDTIKMIFGFVGSMLKTIVMVFEYLLTIVNLAFNVVTTLPDWLRAFCVITISISIAYFLIGRNAGRSD